MKTVTYDPELWQLVPKEPTYLNLGAMARHLRIIPADSMLPGPIALVLKRQWESVVSAAPQPPAEPLKELSDDELRDIDGLFILGRLEFARLAIAADRKLNGG